MQLDPLQKPAVRDMPRMVKWYAPGELLRTIMCRLAARFFPPSSDHRLTQAVLDTASELELLTRYDYSEDSRNALPLNAEDGSFWIDHIAETGDGFLASYPLAYLLAQDELYGAGSGTTPMVDAIRGVPIGSNLPAGQLLFMSGDHAYPTPSRAPSGRDASGRDTYASRLQQPFDLAGPNGEPDRAVFALPGRRDRDDGLLAFDHMFCSARSRFSDQRGRQLGRYHCRQHRSYFAIKLPHDWWIWAPDIPSDRAIDDRQLSYFFETSRLMSHKDKVVLLTGEPSWLDAETEGQSAFRNVSQIIQLFRKQNAKLCAVLASGMHNYSRYKCEELNLNLITSGGGGGYTQPTHQLPGEVDIHWQFQKRGEQQWRTKRLNFSMLRKRAPDELDGTPRPTIEPACYPSNAKSKRLSWQLLALPFYNWKISMIAGLAYLVLASIFAQVEIPKHGENGTATVQSLLEQSFAEAQSPSPSATALLLKAVPNSPALASGLLLLFMALYAYANFDGTLTRRRAMRIMTASWHFLAHVTAITTLYVFCTWLNFAVIRPAAEAFFASSQAFWAASAAQLAQIPVLAELSQMTQTTLINGVPAETWLTLLYPVEFIFLGGVVAGGLVGLYMFINCRFLKLHCCDSFSALAIEDYKHFLRIRFDHDKLTLYPIALNRVPSGRGWRMSEAWQLWFKEPGKARPTGPIFQPRRALKPRLVEGPIEIDAKLVLNIPR